MSDITSHLNMISKSISNIRVLVNANNKIGALEQITQIENRILSLRKLVKPQNIITKQIRDNSVATERVIDGRTNNDKVGKSRENTTLYLLQSHLIGKRFEPNLLNSVPEEHITLFKCLCDTQPEGALVKNVMKKGGRGNNHDLVIEYTLHNISSHVHLEIKGGNTCSKIEDCPQVLSLAEKDDAFQTPDKSYAEYFYDNYLQVFNRSFKEPFGEELPTRDEYIKFVYSSDCKKHPWFEYAKYRSPTKSPASKLVDVSIKEFLVTHLGKFDIMKIIERVRSTQLGKLFLLQNKRTRTWSQDRFNESDFIIADTPPTVHIKNNNSLVINLRNSIIICLLRWKNRKGVLYPAYQIKVIRRR